jgi:hypothetical protein
MSRRGWAFLSSLLLLGALPACDDGGPGLDPLWADASPLATGLGRPMALGADDTHVYWAETDPESPWTNHLRRMPRAGGAPETLLSQAAGLLAVAVDDEAIYYLDSAHLFRWAKGTDEATVLHEAGGGESLLAREGRLFWWSQDGRVLTVLPDGTDARVVAEGQELRGAIAVDSDHVYWGDLATERVVSASWSGDASELRVHAEGECAHGTAVDGEHVYWLRAESCPLSGVYDLRRAPRTGGPAEDVAGSMEALASAGDTAFAASTDRLYRLGSGAPVYLARTSAVTCHTQGAMGSCIGPSALFAEPERVFLAAWWTTEGRIGVVAPE